MRFYRLLSALPRPKSYIGKILFVSFVGVHIPLLALIVYLLLLSDIAMSTVLPVVIVLLVATIGGTLATFAALYALLAPVRASSAAVRSYLQSGVLPRLPAGAGYGADAAARLMADIQEGLTRLDCALAASEAAKEATEAEKKEVFGLVSRLSHDLRTPLNAIVGFSQMMHNEMLGPLGSKAYQGYARDIETSSQHLLDRIQRILDLSQMESEDGLPPLLESVAIDQAVDEAVRAKHLHAESAGLAMAVSEAAGLQVSADRSALVQAIMNIISVAIETTSATDRSAGRVTVSSVDGTDGVVLSVADNGRALDRNDVPNALVDRGPIADHDATTSPEGVGDATSVSLSLLLADRLAQLSGARFSWHYVDGKGKLFHLALARAATEAHEIAA